jgi:hypothetical protein
VLVFATTGLPFGFCLLMLMAALYLSRSKSKVRLFFSGGFVGAAAASSFLTIPALLVMLFWIVRRERAKALFFAAGVAFAFTPLLVLLLVTPDSTILDVFKYHLFDRPKFGWRYNLGEVVRWVATLQSMLLLLLAVAAVWNRKDEEVRLSAWIALALIVTLAAARTTSSFYFLPATPFLAILATAGVDEIARKRSRYSSLITAGVGIAYLIGLLGLKQVWRWQAPYYDHRAVEIAVKEIEQCAPSGNFYAPEAVYFETRHLPPRGLENRFDPHWDANRRMQVGALNAVLIGPGDPRIEQFQLGQRYAWSEVLGSGRDRMMLFCDSAVRNAATPR